MGGLNSDTYDYGYEGRKEPLHLSVDRLVCPVPRSIVRMVDSPVLSSVPVTSVLLPIRFHHSYIYYIVCLFMSTITLYIRRVCLVIYTFSSVKELKS